MVTDWLQCIGCGLCVDLCKYGAIKLNTEKKPLICDHCDGNPECVKRCPTNAIRYEEAPEFTETVFEAFNRMKEEWGFNE
jgi:Fe-S-cluster-containing hydrogenase component 2